MFETVISDFSLGDEVTKGNVLKMAIAKKDYSEAKAVLSAYEDKRKLMTDEEDMLRNEAEKFVADFDESGLIDKINNFIDNVINKDSAYYSKLSGYGISPGLLQYCLC